MDSTKLASLSKADRASTIYHDLMARVKDSQALIDSATTANDLTQPLHHLAALRAWVTEVHDDIPARDQNTYHSVLEQLHTQITTRRTTLQKSKGKFSFRRATPASTSRPNASSPPATASAASLRSEQPELPERPEHREQPEPPAPVLSTSSVGTPPSRPTPGRSWEHQRGAKLQWSDELLLGKSGDLHLSHLDGCLVDLRTRSSLDHHQHHDDDRRKPNNAVLQAAFVRNVHHSILLLGTVEGSVLVHDCQNTLIVGQCRQYRMHDSMRTICLITTPSALTLEGCRGVRIGSCPRVGRGEEDPQWQVASQDAGPTGPLVPTVPGPVQDFDHVSRLTSSPNWTRCEDGTQVVGRALKLWSQGEPLASNSQWLALLQQRSDER